MISFFLQVLIVPGKLEAVYKFYRFEFIVWVELPERLPRLLFQETGFI
jgi:hypothetical protein